MKFNFFPSLPQVCTVIAKSTTASFSLIFENLIAPFIQRERRKGVVRSLLNPPTGVPLDTVFRRKCTITNPPCHTLLPTRHKVF